MKYFGQNPLAKVEEEIFTSVGFKRTRPPSAEGVNKITRLLWKGKCFFFSHFHYINARSMLFVFHAIVVENTSGKQKNNNIETRTEGWGSGGTDGRRGGDGVGGSGRR